MGGKKVGSEVLAGPILRARNYKKTISFPQTCTNFEEGKTSCGTEMG